MDFFSIGQAFRWAGGTGRRTPQYDSSYLRGRQTIIFFLTGFNGLFVCQFPACLAIASAKLRRLDETDKMQSPSAKELIRCLCTIYVRCNCFII